LWGIFRGCANIAKGRAKAHNFKIHFSNIRFWLRWRREDEAASTFLSTRGSGGYKKEEAPKGASS